MTTVISLSLKRTIVSEAKFPTELEVHLTVPCTSLSLLTKLQSCSFVFDAVPSVFPHPLYPMFAFFLNSRRIRARSSRWNSIWQHRMADILPETIAPAVSFSSILARTRPTRSSVSRWRAESRHRDEITDKSAR